MEEKEILEGLKNENMYEFIFLNYYKMSNEQLRDIATELIVLSGDTENTREKLIKNLKEYKGWEE